MDKKYQDLKIYKNGVIERIFRCVKIYGMQFLDDEFIIKFSDNDMYFCLSAPKKSRTVVID